MVTCNQQLLLTHFNWQYFSKIPFCTFQVLFPIKYYVFSTDVYKISIIETIMLQVTGDRGFELTRVGHKWVIGRFNCKARDCRIHIERESMRIRMYTLHTLDKFKQVFIYYTFNINWIRKTVLKTEICFALF